MGYLSQKQFGAGLAALIILFAAGAAHARGPDHRDQLPDRLTKSDFISVSQEKARLGQLLFFDKELSGNRNIACATCHHPDLGSSDGLSLGIGEGGENLGQQRSAGYGSARAESRIPRNAPALFNLGAKDILNVFHDGRVEADPTMPSGFRTPAGNKLPEGLESALAAQALFPMTSEVEMAGTANENEVGLACETDITEGWKMIESRFQSLKAYEAPFLAAYPDRTSIADITIVDIANAIGAFVAQEWQSNQSPFDAYLAGRSRALTKEQKFGMQLFYGKGDCASCHSGSLFTDQKFHAIAMPQFGPGKNVLDGEISTDYGRFNETGNEEDRYRFRTPSLRNVEHTAPYGHTGAYSDLKSVVRHHLDPLTALQTFDREEVILTDADTINGSDFLLSNTDEWINIAAANELAPKELTEQEINALVAFLGALTDEKSLPGKLGKPATVPSGLPVD
ncbi:MAG: methylamine utilization protein MauG [Alphaproteobacteria bacterium]|nr:MAG: methylamine utilization protein MauG [Alphaproteobacteria bacterium]